MRIRRPLPFFLLIILVPAFLLYGAGQNVLFDDFNSLANWSVVENPSGALVCSGGWTYLDAYGLYEANLTWVGSSFSLEAWNVTAYVHDEGDSSSDDGTTCVDLVDSAGNVYSICHWCSATNAYIRAYLNGNLLEEATTLTGNEYQHLSIAREIGGSVVFCYKKAETDPWNQLTSVSYQGYPITELRVRLKAYGSADTSRGYAGIDWIRLDDISYLDTPSLVSPVEETVDSLSVTLSWSGVANAGSYWLQVSSYSDFSALEVNTTTTSTEYAFSAPSEGTWYWRVKALPAAGSDYRASDWNSTSFMISIPPLDTPTPLGPANGTWVSEADMTLSWSGVANAGSYWLQVSSYSDFSALEVNLTTAQTSVVFHASSNGERWWRVKALTSDPAQYKDSAWSSPCNFTVDTVAPLVTNLAPDNGTVRLSATVTVQWSSSDNFVLQSQRVNWVLPNGTAQSADVSVDAGSYDITSDDGPVRWYVQAWDEAGNRRDGEQWVYIVDTRLPHKPTPLSPANGTWITSDTVTLNWTTDDPDMRMTRLHVIRVGGGFQFTQDFGPGDQSYTLTFPAEGQYWWWVTSVDWAGNGADSENRTFYVVMGTVVPQNLSAGDDWWRFYAVERSNSPQTFNYVVRAYTSSGVLQSEVSGSDALGASESALISGSWTSQLSTGIYRMVVTCYDESGAAKTNETWFLVATSVGGVQRDWTSWAANEHTLGQEVNFTRMYFEYAEDPVASHQVKLAIQGRPSDARVFVLDENYRRVKEIPAEAVTNYVIFTAEELGAGESRTYLVEAYFPDLNWSEEEVKKVVYEGYLAREINLTIENQYPYPVLTLKVPISADWLGWEASGWEKSADNETLVLSSGLSPGESVTITVYEAIQEGGAENSSSAGQSSNWLMDNWPALLAITLSLVVFIVLVGRRKR